VIAATWALLRSKVAGYLAAIGAVLAVLLAAYSKGRNDAKANATKDRLAAANKAREVENEVDSLGDADVDAGLQRWMRDREG
jgi:hypothetical protein